MRIGNVSLGERPLVIAEIGNNHEGSFDVAARLVRGAAECGVEAVKFQTFRTEHYIDRQDPARFARLKKFELRGEQFAELSKLARSLGMLFISTPLDLGSARLLEPLVDAFKVASGDNDFFPLIRQDAATGTPLIVSTGASDLARVRSAVAAVRDARGHTRNVALLHCVSAYPVPHVEANLRAIATLSKEFDLPVGYSDHTTGLEASVLAVALGARLIEKHFTLDHHFSDFRDHQLSANPEEMRVLLERVREASEMLGSGVKTVQPCEEAIVPVIRRSIAAARDLPARHKITLDDLDWLRPGGGIGPGNEDSVIGRRLRRAVAAGERISSDDLT